MGSPIEGWTRQSAVKCAVNYRSGFTFKLEHEAVFLIITAKPRKMPLAVTLLPSIHYVSGSNLGRTPNIFTVDVRCFIQFFQENSGHNLEFINDLFLSYSLP
jgi:hypothetical protein